MPLCPSGSTSSSASGCHGPSPRRSQSSSSWLSFRCVATGEAELPAGGVHLARARVRGVRRDTEADQARDSPVPRSPASPRTGAARRRLAAEDLEVDDRAQAELRAGMRTRAAEGEVADGRDARAQALRGAEPRDRLHVGPLEPALPLDVQRDPRAEGEPVAEAGVDGVLEVRVRVDEARDDRRLRDDARPRRARRSCPTAAIRAVLDRERAVLDRLALHGEHPVGGEDPHSTAQRERCSAMSQRFSMNAASQIESSKRSEQRHDLERERDRVDRREQHGEHDHEERSRAAGSAAARGREDSQPDEREDEDRHLEDEPDREQRQRHEREVVARPDLRPRRRPRRSSSGSRSRAAARRSSRTRRRPRRGRSRGPRRRRPFAGMRSSIAGARNAQSWQSSDRAASSANAAARLTLIAVVNGSTTPSVIELPCRPAAARQPLDQPLAGTTNATDEGERERERG